MSVLFSFRSFDRDKIHTHKLKLTDRIKTLKVQFFPSPSNFFVKFLFVSSPSLRGRPPQSPFLRPHCPLSLFLTFFLPSFRFLHFIFPFSSSPDPSAIVVTLSCGPRLLPSLRTHPMSSLRRSHVLLLSIGLSPPQVSHLFALHPLLLTHPFLLSLHFLSSLPPFPPSSSLPSFSSATSSSPSLLRPPSSLPFISLLLTFHVKSTILPKLDFLLNSLLDEPLLYPHVPPLPTHQAYSPPLFPPPHLHHPQQPPSQGSPRRD